jgi:sporulation protein YlmC with PRC-barrel domain
MANERKSSADEAGVGPDPRQVRHLTPLRELRRFRLAKGEPDIRGWSVFTSNGRDVGRVADLLVDTTIGEAVLLDVAVTGSGQRVTAPIRAAWIDRPTKRVILDSAELSGERESPLLGRTGAPEEPRQLADQPPVADQPRRLSDLTTPTPAAPPPPDERPPANP